MLFIVRLLGFTSAVYTDVCLGMIIRLKNTEDLTVKRQHLTKHDQKESSFQATLLSLLPGGREVHSSP